MSEDKILKMFFEDERWEYAINKGVDKDINKGELYRLCQPETRLKMCEAIVSGKYEICPPHTAQIPKDTPGEFRTVYINEPIDRVFLSIANDLLFELCPEMIHPRCKSYLKGVGCGQIVKRISEKICQTQIPGWSDVIGWKADLSKYFDSVPIERIDVAFNRVEEIHGHSAIIDVLRKYYHNDYYFDTVFDMHGNLYKSYQSLKQGCSVASWLADVILYDVDQRISSLDVEYVRYSDDMLCVGKDHMEAMRYLKGALQLMRMRLNPNKVEDLCHGKWFKFLGFSIKDGDISLSKNRIKTFQREIEKRTIRKRGVSLKSAINSVNNYLYKGNGEHSWATQILPVVNVKKDIDTLNQFVMDALRAVQTGKRKLGGLGYVVTQQEGCVTRGVGRNVKANRERTPKQIEGYLTLGCMQNALKTTRPVYDTLVANL